MSDQAVRVVWCGMLLVHGLGHFGALAAVAWWALRPGTATGAWTAARSRLAPSLAPGTAALVAGAFWTAALVGFVSAVVSTVGMVLFFGTWPMFNTVAALGVNAVVLIALLVLHWTPPPG